MSRHNRDYNDDYGYRKVDRALSYIFLSLDIAVCLLRIQERSQGGLILRLVC